MAHLEKWCAPMETSLLTSVCLLFPKHIRMGQAETVMNVEPILQLSFSFFFVLQPQRKQGHEHPEIAEENGESDPNLEIQIRI